MSDVETASSFKGAEGIEKATGTQVVEDSEKPEYPQDAQVSSIEQPVSKPDYADFPEGGKQAWLTILGGFCISFCTLGAIQGFGVYQAYYTLVSLTNVSASAISWIGSIQIFLAFGMGLLSGKLFDEGYFKHIMAGGSLLYLFSLFMLSLVKPHEYYQNFLSQGLGVGLGMGFLFIPCLSIPSHYFRRRRSLATGLTVSGTALGGIVWPILTNRLFNGSAGFGWGVRASGFLALVFLIIANLLMKTRLPPRKLRPAAKPIDIKAVLTDVPYLIYVFGGTLVFWGLFFPFFYLQLFAELHGIDPNLTIYTIPILNAGALFGRSIPGFLADLYGPLNIGIPLTAAAGGLMFMMLAATNKHTLIAFAILYGFFSGAFVTLSSAAVVVFANDVGEIGLRIGLASFVLSFALLTGNPISGALLKEPEYDWSKPITFAGIVILCGCVFLAISRHLVIKKRGTWKV